MIPKSPKSYFKFYIIFVKLILILYNFINIFLMNMMSKSAKINSTNTNNTTIAATTSTTIPPLSSNESLRNNFTKEMLMELEETFHLASEGNGKLSASKLPLALKALGMNTNEAEIPLPEKDLDYDKFLEIVINCMKQPNWVANEMIETYQLFDRDRLGNAYMSNHMNEINIIIYNIHIKY
jgi:hypothetical protein